MSELTEPLPCPFCGAKAEVVLEEDREPDLWIVSCLGCVAHIEEVGKSSAIAAWNRRTLPNPVDQPKVSEPDARETMGQHAALPEYDPTSPLSVAEHVYAQCEQTVMSLHPLPENSRAALLSIFAHFKKLSLAALPQPQATTVGVTEPPEMALLRGPLSKRATSAEFNEWQAREIVSYVDRLRSALIDIPGAEKWAVAWAVEKNGEIIDATTDPKAREEWEGYGYRTIPLAVAPAPTSERVQALEEAAEHYFYALNAAHGDLVRQMLQQNRPIKDIEGVGNFRALNELARRNGFRMLVTIEPVPDAAALKATP